MRLYNQNKKDVLNHYNELNVKLSLETFETDTISNVTTFVNNTNCYDFELNNDNNIIIFKYLNLKQ